MLLLSSLGHSTQSPIGFALFGVMLSNMGNITVGHRFSLLAMALLDKHGSKDVAGEVMYMISRVKCLMEPLQSINEFQSQAELASLSAGDVQFACMNRVSRYSNKFWAGTKLAEVKEEVLQAILFVQRHEYNAVLDEMMRVEWVISMLTGIRAESDFDPVASEQRNRTPILWLQL